MLVTYISSRHFTILIRQGYIKKIIKSKSRLQFSNLYLVGLWVSSAFSLSASGLFSSKPCGTHFSLPLLFSLFLHRPLNSSYLRKKTSHSNSLSEPVAIIISVSDFFHPLSNDFTSFSTFISFPCQRQGEKIPRKESEHTF